MEKMSALDDFMAITKTGDAESKREAFRKVLAEIVARPDFSPTTREWWNSLEPQAAEEKKTEE
jgi:D-alanyl-D-alanine dipeptidase